MLIETIDLFRSEDALGNLRSDKDIDWEASTQKFIKALENECSSEKLEEAVVYKWSWELPIDLKFSLLNRAKESGCDSFEFWRDYYQYRATYLEPDDPNRPFALEMANGKYL